ncbi:MAG: UvrD-helicase domain-containing protein [Deltaproteobacteria bacterium]|nr:UvrD-helicase domain-containing protein [Deltaproteobacteria bacterium]MBW2109845.1 UvrD-helicase domain-containing protein [Deltaproteobacteria bacterium]
MRFIADLHIHSRYSRATSRSLCPENLSLWAQKKGITLLGTGDFTHPAWVSELKDKLVEGEGGLYELRSQLQEEVRSQVPGTCRRKTHFILSGEISCIYKRGGRTRKLHHLVLMPEISSVIRFNEKLNKIGNIISDGRPILGLDSRDLLEIVLETDERAFLIPAHIWTPWFSLFGSKSGFDTIEECFGDLTGHIHALETGLSSDPPMNRCLSALDRYVLVSNSDAHSPGKLGREANIFDTELDYDHVIRAMTDGNGLKGTIEFFPEEGKYHLDGHRKCGVRLEPPETAELNGVCPVCGRPLTVGVLNRVYQLSDRDTPRLFREFISLIPLPEVLSELLCCGPATKKVGGFYENLISRIGPELEILIDLPLERIEEAGGPALGEAVARMRRNQVIREGGYDGQFGVMRLFEAREREALAGQMALFALKEPGSRPGASLPGKNKRGKRKKEALSEPLSPREDPILDPLNPEQLSAVLYDAGHLLVAAGPGTGKTMTLCHRMAHLVRNSVKGEERILALTFTRKACREVKERTAMLVPGPGAFRVVVTTFHGFCLDLLRREALAPVTGLPPGFALCSEADSLALARQVLGEAGAKGLSLNRFMGTLQAMKAHLALDNGREGLLDDRLLSLCRHYQGRLREANMLDLDDLEVEVLRLLKERPEIAGALAREFPRVFVDEYQDTNPIQVQLLKALIGVGEGHIFAIGDPDQAIYGFRGADVTGFHRFSHDFPGAGEIALTRNYRSTRSILKASALVMGREKPLEGTRGPGHPISLAPCLTESEEAEMIVEQVERLLGGTSFFSMDSGRVFSGEGEKSLGFGDMGVLYRLNYQGDALEKALTRAGIPFVRSGEAPLIARYPANVLWRLLLTIQYPENPFYQRAYRDLCSDREEGKEKLRADYEQGAALLELLDEAVEIHRFHLDSEDAEAAFKRMREMATGYNGDLGPFLDALSLERGIDHNSLMGDRLALMSIHAAKGLEWPVVFVTGCEDGLLPCTLFGDNNKDEERRLFYVAMTRARSRLILSSVKRRRLNGRMLQMKPSPFLEAIPENLCEPLHRGAWKRKKRGPRQLNLF